MTALVSEDLRRAGVSSGGDSRRERGVRADGPVSRWSALDGLGPVQASERVLCQPPQDGSGGALLLSLCATRRGLMRGLQAAEDLSDEPLLNYYTKEWDRYTTGASYVNRLFTYLNRHWVKREKDEGRKNVYVVYIVSFTSLSRVLAGRWSAKGS